MSYKVVRAGPPGPARVVRSGLSARDAIAALAETRAALGPSFVEDDRGRIVGSRTLEKEAEREAGEKRP